MGWTREQFLQERRKSLGGSDAGAILGISPFSSPRKVYEEKVNGLGTEASERMQLGIFLEDPIARMYEAQTGLRVEKPLDMIFRNPKYPYLHASLDRYAYAHGRKKPLEIKYAADWSGWGQEGTDEVPAVYKAQCLHYLLVLEEEEMDLAVLLPGTFRIYTVRFEADTAAQMLGRENAFWETHILPEYPPPLDIDLSADLALASKLHGYRNGLELDLPALQEGILEEYLRWDEQLKEAKTERDRFKALILEMMGEAAYARGREGCYARRKQIQRKAYQVAATEYVTLTVGKAKQ